MLRTPMRLFRQLLSNIGRYAANLNMKTISFLYSVDILYKLLNIDLYQELEYLCEARVIFLAETQ